MDIAIEQMGFVDNKIVIDTSNQYDIVLQEGTTAASEVQRRLLGARLVKAFNTLNYADLLTRAFHVPLYVIPYSGDDSEANARTANLIASIGFEPFYTGTLSKVAAQELHGPLAGKLLTVEQAKNLLWDAQ